MDHSSEADGSRAVRARAGDLEALAELFARHREKVQRLVEFRLDPRLARRVGTSDVVQDVWIEASSRRGHIPPEDEVPFWVWLRTITVQRLADVHRHHLATAKRDVKRELEPMRAPHPDATSASIVRHLAGDGASPSEDAQRRELAERLEDVLASLEPIDREVIALRHFEELTNAETANVLGIEPSAASKRYLRALRRLRGAIDGFSEFSERGDVLK